MSLTLRLPSIVPHSPSPKQAAFLLYDGLEALYGGAAGGGKTDALLMAALQYIDHPKYAALLLRRSYTDLSLPGALMDRAHEWFSTARKRGEVHWDRETHTFTFPSGSTLTFGYIQSSKDKYRYQSAEFQFIGWDEVTEFPDEGDYTWMFSRMRKLEGMDIPLRMRCASNPVGPGVHWVRRRFFFDEDLSRKDRIFIPAKFTDNPHIDKESYSMALQEMHPALRAKLIEGSWDVIEDAAFPEFDPHIHVIPAFNVPKEWRHWEGMDFGVSNPTAWLAAALSPHGYTVIHGEYYNPGLISRHASEILTKRNFSWGEPLLAVCDPSIRNRTGFGQSGMGQTVHSVFADNGVYLVPANNDRRAGRIRISELLKLNPEREFPEFHPRARELNSPSIFITENCENLIDQLKFAPIDSVDGEVVDPYWESRRGHAIAALRYLSTARVYPDVSNPTRRESFRTLRPRADWPSFKDWRET